MPYQFLYLVANDQVGLNESFVTVGERCSLKQPFTQELEEHGSATDEGFVITRDLE